MRTEDVQRPTQSMSTDLPGVTEFKGAQSPPLDPDIIDVEPASSDCCFREHENRSNNSLKRIAESEATHPPKTKTARLFSKDKPSAAEITTSNGFSSASPVVGSRVMNWWRDDSKSRGSYYSGRVEEVNRETGEVLVQYEDGDIAWEGVNPKENPGFVVLGTAKKLPKYPMNAVFFKVCTSLKLKEA